MPLRLRVDGFADGGTHISHNNRAKTAIVYITLHPRQKQGQMPLRMRVDGFADGGTHISHNNRAKTAIVYITLHPRQKQGQNAIAHACGRLCRWWDTYITPQSCQDCYRVYHASSTAKTRAKRHCACVWMDLQMVGHIYQPAIVLRRTTFILGRKQGQMPLRMRVDGFADGGTHISNHNRANRAIMYITLHPRQNLRHCACVWTGLQMVGHISPTTLVLCLACLCLFSEKAIVCLSDIPRIFITYSTFCIY